MRSVIFITLKKTKKHTENIILLLLDFLVSSKPFSRLNLEYSCGIKIQG